MARVCIGYEYHIYTLWYGMVWYGIVWYCMYYKVVVE